jgi:hypothetical protein
MVEYAIYAISQFVAVFGVCRPHAVMGNPVFSLALIAIARRDT